VAKFKTPAIPGWIRQLAASGYTNIFSCKLGNANLFGTETLLGDWDGLILVVAKDFAPFDEVERLQNAAVDPSTIYRHNDGDGRYRTGLKTNTRLLKFMFGDQLGPTMIRGDGNTECGALYISACFFLKGGADPSSSLEGWRVGGEAFDNSCRVAEFVIDHMPNLRCIACLGVDALDMMKHVPIPKRGRPIHLHSLPHPSRGSNDVHRRAWASVYATSGLQVVGHRVVPVDQSDTSAAPQSANVVHPVAERSNLVQR
jgi:hypothetical protein